jgi:aldehyde:ferredoxin oxidoreductase
MYGYCGRILDVDLTLRKITVKELDESIAHNFLGGSGIACRLLYDLVNNNTAPFSPDNVLIFFTGPLTGTKAPCCSRYVACGISPLTNIWCEANSGGFWATALKRAGFDGIIIKGRAKNLVYLDITSDTPQIKGCEFLKGEDVYETQRILKSELSEKSEKKDAVRIACIGLAGENLVRYAAILNDGARAAGRGGLGAVMGSKNLKAIAVRGDKKVNVAHPEKFDAVAKEVMQFIKDSFACQMLGALGTSGYVELAQELGDMPNKYYTAGRFESASKLSGSTMAETILTGNTHCYNCPIGCGRMVEIKSGKYRIHKTEGPEYETVASLGSLLLVDNLEGVALANYLCNYYGIDTISCGITIALAYYLYEKGIIDRKATDNMVLKWGDIDTVISLIHKIARREGIGDILADGNARFAAKFNASEYAATVKNMEVPMHDIRAFPAMAVCYATAPRGACHLHGDMYQVELGSAIPELEIEAYDRFDEVDKSKTIAKIQHLRTVYNALIMCHFATPPPDKIAELLTCATGFEYDLKKLDLTGERIFNMKRAFNNKLGITSKDDKMPSILLAPLKNGGTEGNVPDFENQLKKYYEYREWCLKTGKPTREKLVELALNDIADDLWKDEE